ncbi:MAG: bifunctional DNA-formamidopyrimidine glycosylase/DNA-(apurinic or apyrimidinic site) lyase [Actinomycetales bacterium]|nr:bifunctional DNA-formamidopyrimidine glycosylase/DNA-(apurinic or apyrimidinic site) lyase [Candidatus Phosphoribacter baldrii]
MPELPEVEVVRVGLATHVVGRTIEDLQVRGARVARRHLAGPDDLVARVRHTRVEEARRRGKYLWLVLATPGGDRSALLLHLGMSGQLLVKPPEAPDERHLHARFGFADDGPELRFVDQRTFGGMALAELDIDDIPDTIGHIAPDPFDPAYDQRAVIARLKARHSAIKRGLLDQTVVSGIGNIYADEALWRAGVHGERPSDTLSRPALGRLLDHAREVMGEALAKGGTSFDALYVNVNGASGYFDRSLAAYGQVGRPCGRCGTLIVREHFMNRSSYFCPQCQPRPRTRAEVLI